MATEGRSSNLLEQFLQYSLIMSALIGGIFGYYTWSLKKMIITYGVGVLFILAVALPDWAFFRRHPSEWRIPLAADLQSAIAQKVRFEILNRTPKYAGRFNFYPVRMILFTISYGFILYSVWRFIMA